MRALQIELGVWETSDERRREAEYDECVMIRLDQVMIRLRLVVAGEFSQAELTW
jgi:hypothetical protein